MQDADEPVGQLAQGGVVADAAGALAVVVGACSGRSQQRVERLRCLSEWWPRLPWSTFLCLITTWPGSCGLWGSEISRADLVHLVYPLMGWLFDADEPVEAAAKSVGDAALAAGQLDVTGTLERFDVDLLGIVLTTLKAGGAAKTRAQIYTRPTSPTRSPHSSSPTPRSAS
ncbi:hypothetical protein GCM10023214_05400 [Amycolatopsis dongchuanensis]|uniref:Uncharacterized protein n=1 Tax=Amycolatopsis dongchuanensis TaxID=1070866 RepID=A0ABP9PYN8_9PSEU